MSIITGYSAKQETFRQMQIPKTVQNKKRFFVLRTPKQNKIPIATKISRF
jgi:hypothetical protein